MTREASVRQLRDFILEHPRLMVLTGAGSARALVSRHIVMRPARGLPVNRFSTANLCVMLLYANGTGRAVTRDGPMSRAPGLIWLIWR